MSQTEFAILTEKLSRRFSRLDAVNALDLAAPKQSIYALLGPNGAGKSTTLSILMNLLQPSSGRSTVLGIESTQLKARDFHRIGYVAESQELPTG